MTVSNSNSKNNYIANGTNTTFVYAFKIFEASELIVYVNDAVVTNYTVTGVGDANGGTIVFNTAPANNARVTILRNIPLTQLINLPSGDNDPSIQMTEGLDRCVMLAQKFFEELSRCIKVSPSSTAQINIPSAEPSKAIGWNGAGDALVNLAVVGGALLGDQDILGWLKASSYLESQLFNVVQGGISDTEFGIDYYRTGSTQRDAVDAILELATSTVQASQGYTGNGTQTVFTVSFYVLAAVDLQVKVNGSVVTNYTVQNVGRRNGEMTVTFASAPANGAVILFERINLTKYVLRKTIGLFSQHDKNVKLNYIDMTSEFTEFARGIRLPINPNAPVSVTSDVTDCNGVLRHGCHVASNGAFASKGQRGIAGIIKFGNGAYDITLTSNAPSYSHPTVTPITTVADITATAIQQAVNVYRVYTKLARTDIFTDCQFDFGLYY